MDVVYVFQHSRYDDLEIQYSLRSVAKHLTWVRKVWIFGDSPAFLSDDKSRIECIPWDAVAWIGRFRTPVRSFFLQCFLLSLWPELDSEFLLFCDDFILLDTYSETLARKDRYLQVLDQIQNRGKGLWKDQLWRTYDWLKRLGYTGFNFETHAPYYLTRRRVFEAYRDLHDFVTEDWRAGMVGPTGILNHAYRQQSFPLTRLSDEGLHVGFHYKPARYADIIEKTNGKLFLNFDDEAFSDDLRRFLAERFPEPCVYERCGSPSSAGIGFKIVN